MLKHAYKDSCKINTVSSRKGFTARNRRSKIQRNLSFGCSSMPLVKRCFSEGLQETRKSQGGMGVGATKWGICHVVAQSSRDREALLCMPCIVDGGLNGIDCSTTLSTVLNHSSHKDFGVYKNGENKGLFLSSGPCTNRKCVTIRHSANCYSML